MIFTVLDEVSDYLKLNSGYVVEDELLDDLDSYSDSVNAVLIVTDATGVGYDESISNCLKHKVSFQVFIVAFENSSDEENIISKQTNASNAYLKVIDLLYNWQPTTLNVSNFGMDTSIPAINPENKNSVYNSQMLIGFTYDYLQNLS